MPSARPAARSGAALHELVERHARALKGALVAFYLLMGLANLRWGGGFWPDENFYVYGAEAVLRGGVPYVDFFWTQGPLPAYVYAAVAALAHDLYALRLAALLMGLGAILLASAAAARVGGPTAGVVACAALALCPPLLVHFSVASPTPLVALLLAGAAYALARPERGVARFAAASVLVALAATVRLNVALVFPALGLYALLARDGGWRAAAASVLGALPLPLAYAPFLAMDAGAVWWNVVGYHALDSRDPSLSLFQVLKYKLDGLSYFLTGCLFAAVAAAIWLASAAWRLREGPARLLRPMPFTAFLALAAALGVGATFTKVYVQLYYFVMFLPLLAVLAGVMVAGWMRDPPLRGHAARVVAALLVVGFLAAAPPYVRTYAERIDHLREAAAFVEANTPEDRPVFTFGLDVAFQAGRQALPGTEMGVFGWAPALDQETATRYHLLTLPALKDALERQVPGAVVLMGDDLSFSAIPSARVPPERQQEVAELRATLEARYRPEAAFADGRIVVWLPREGAA